MCIAEKMLPHTDSTCYRFFKVYLMLSSTFTSRTNLPVYCAKCSAAISGSAVIYMRLVVYSYGTRGTAKRHPTHCRHTFPCTLMPLVYILLKYGPKLQVSHQPLNVHWCATHDINLRHVMNILKDLIGGSSHDHL